MSMSIPGVLQQAPGLGVEPGARSGHLNPQKPGLGVETVPYNWGRHPEPPSDTGFSSMITQVHGVQ